MKPPLSDQTDIAGILGIIDRRITSAESRRLVLGELFRTLLHQLMTAQIRVHDLKIPELEATP
jgi:type I restriction enzyme, S subunit